MDLLFQPPGVGRGDDQEVLAQGLVLRRVGGQLGADREQLLLQAQDGGGATAVAHLGPGQAERGDRLVDRAVGLGARIGLAHPASVEEAGLATVSSPGDDALAGHSGGRLQAAPRDWTSCAQSWSTAAWLAKASRGSSRGLNQPTS